MSEPTNPDLMPSLGRLVRGLSALFWGLPLAFLVCCYTAKAEALRAFGILPPLASIGLLLYGLLQLGAFQRQERIWHAALDRARLLGLLNLGLSPFLYWWNRVPTNLFFLSMVLLMTISGLLFLGSLNLVLQRLGAMLPDEALRLETKQFTAINLNLLGVTFVFGLLYYALGRLRQVPLSLQILQLVLDRASLWFLIPLVLLPLAMTMALLWKTKQVILDSVFQVKR